MTAIDTALPRVTEIIRSMGYGWRCRHERPRNVYLAEHGLEAPNGRFEPPRVTEVSSAICEHPACVRARDVGTAVHEAMALWCRGELAEWELDPDVRRRVDALTSALDAWKAAPVASERSVVCAHERYRGTLDLVALLPSGEHVLVDYKSGETFHKSACLQVALYRYGWNASAVGPKLFVRRAFVLHPRGKSWRLVDIDTIEPRNWEAHALGIVRGWHLRELINPTKGEGNGTDE